MNFCLEALEQAFYLGAQPVDNGGQLQMRRDVYNLDGRTLAAIKSERGNLEPAQNETLTSGLPIGLGRKSLMILACWLDAD
jgi:hypothetical protein